MKTEYKVEWHLNSTYKVVKYTYGDFWIQDGMSVVYVPQMVEIVFQGSISDCNAWLQLNDNRYL